MTDDQADLDRLRALEAGGQLHPLFTSFPAWVDWLLVVHIDAVRWRSRWFQLPMVVMELDTLWRSWRQAWGPDGSVGAKQAWFTDADHALFRCEQLFDRFNKVEDQPNYVQPFLPDTPTGTLGRFTGRELLDPSGTAGPTTVRGRTEEDSSSRRDADPAPGGPPAGVPRSPGRPGGPSAGAPDWAGPSGPGPIAPR